MRKWNNKINSKAGQKIKKMTFLRLQDRTTERKRKDKKPQSGFVDSGFVLASTNYFQTFKIIDQKVTKPDYMNVMPKNVLFSLLIWIEDYKEDFGRNMTNKKPAEIPPNKQISSGHGKIKTYFIILNSSLKIQCDGFYAPKSAYRGN